ncbi:hypothetical protein F5B17DRAFT_382756 [Nemania serpens]|nr:hypothetical protein F5B17DRAFT_382756 [Nemania serpens]
MCRPSALMMGLFGLRGLPIRLGMSIPGPAYDPPTGTESSWIHRQTTAAQDPLRYDFLARRCAEDDVRGRRPRATEQLRNTEIP